jgi:uncharacterized iron-regulated protein
MRRMAAGVMGSIFGAVTLLAQGGYVPERVFDPARGGFADFEVMLADLATADVVLVGEQHDDPNTHRLELAVLEGLAHRRGNVVVSLEMFERDVQEPLEHFLMGHTAEDEFLKDARPWPRYATDYKPLVDFAIAKNWPVVAANVPRAFASEVSKTGLGALDAKSDVEKAWFAADRQCPDGDDYFHRFAEAMGQHPGDAGVQNFYLAQCLKDETMADSIARAYAAGETGEIGPLVVHINGAFHSDFHEGTAARVQRRLPDKRVVVISMLPVADLDAIAPAGDDLKRGDYLVYTLGKG